MSLVLIAEWHARGLYLEAGYPSMFKYCVGALHMSEDEAFQRIRIARAGREFPAVFAAIAEHRLHMTGALLLAPHLKPENVVSLLDAATHKSKEKIELLLAHPFPRQDVPERVEPISASAEPQPAPPVNTPEHVASDIPYAQAVPASLLAPERVPSPVQPPSPQARVTPLAPERFGVQFTISQGGRDDLRAIQALCAHRASSSSVAEVFEAAWRGHDRRHEVALQSP